MSPRTYTQHRTVEKTASKKIHGEFRSFDKFFKAAGLEEGSSKRKTVSFKAALVQTRGFKFDREEANV